MLDNLQKAREKVCSLHQPNDNHVVEIGVSYDGTWSKRGYTANFEIGFVISVDTGEILDYDFKLKLCMECLSAKRDLREDTNEFDIWFTGHKDKLHWLQWIDGMSYLRALSSFICNSPPNSH